MVMYFGLCNSPATFQRFMNDIFRELIFKEGLIIYMDDILITGRTLEELRRRTIEVFKVLAKHDLYLKPEKCIFESQELEFLGYILTPGKLSTANYKVDGIINWPQPLNPTQIREFLGFCNFYQKFVQNFSDIAQPLSLLTRKNQA